MPLYLKLDSKMWVQGDFTTSNTYDMSGTVYDDARFATTRDISSFTPTLQFIDYDGSVVYSTTTGLTNTGSAGIILIKFSQDNSPYLNGFYKTRLILESSGNRITCIGVNGSDDMFFD